MSRLRDSGRQQRISKPDDFGSEALSYSSCGVNVPAYNLLLEEVKPLLATARGERMVNGVGPFAGLYSLPNGGGYLAASTDGVGTKVKVAIAANEHRGIGLDLVNHCVNDIATSGAQPLFFLDYIAFGQLDGEVFKQLIAGLVEACQKVGCALLGGETAEMPSTYALGDYDIAGFIVGHLAKEIQRPPVQAGDYLIGLPASGIHTNGFSLVNRVFEGVDLGTVYPELGRSLAEELLQPHRCYLEELNQLEWKSAAHITGGGLIDNLPRALPNGLAAEVDTCTWDPLPIFQIIAERGHVAREEMFRTFNMGVGMVLTSSKPIEGYPVIGQVIKQTGDFRVILR